MDEIGFINRANRLLGAPFALGDRSKGYDCLNSMAELFESQGVIFPREFGDWNEANYAERWEKGEGMATFRAFLFSLGEPVDINYIALGDIIILEKKGIVSAGIYLGSGHFRAVHNHLGGIVFPLNFFRRAIAGVRRLIK